MNICERLGSVGNWGLCRLLVGKLSLHFFNEHLHVGGLKGFRDSIMIGFEGLGFRGSMMIGYQGLGCRGSLMIGYLGSGFRVQGFYDDWISGFRA